MKLNINCNFDPLEELNAAFSKAGLVSPSELIMDGQIHRYRANWNKKEDNDSGWYVLFKSNDLVTGAFGDWSQDIKCIFHSSDFDFLTDAEKSERDRLAKEAIEKSRKEREAKQDRVAEESAKVWEILPDADVSNGYVTRKGLKSAYNAKAQGDLLVVPLKDKSGKIWSLQTIAEDGTKKYRYGGKVKGLFNVIGKGTPEYLCEGFATAASIYEATGKVVVMAFSAGNLKAVADQFPGIVIVADNDKSLTGENKAKETGHPYVLIPEFGMDANDYAKAHGLKELAKVLDKKVSRYGLVDGSEWLIQPKPKEWLIKNYILKGRSLSMIFGRSGNGKTFVVVEMMMSLACGIGAFPGLKKKYKVLYLCGEGEDSVRERMAAWFQYHKANIEDIKANLKIEPSAMKMDNPQNAELLVAEIEKAGFVPDLIFVDTLARYMGGDENDTKNANDFIAACDYLENRFNCGVVLVHHTGQGEETQKRERGSSVFRGALDMQLRVDKSNDRIKVINTKNKGGKELDGLTFKLTDHVIEGFVEEDGKTISCAVLELINEKDEPEKKPKSKKQIEDEEFIIHAFLEAGCLVVDRPWISKDNLFAYLTKQMDGKKDAARKAMSIRETSFKDKPRLLERLQMYGDIEVEDNGFYCNGIEVDGVIQPHFTMKIGH